MAKVADELQKELEKYENVIVKRAKKDNGVGYGGRPGEAKNWKCNVYVALHSNGAGSSGNNGIQGPICFYYYKCNQSKVLATNIEKELKKLNSEPFAQGFKFYKNSVYDAWKGEYASEIVFSSINGMVSVLIEHEFHDTMEGANYIKENYAGLAKADALGIAKTFNLKLKEN